MSGISLSLSAPSSFLCSPASFFFASLKHTPIHTHTHTERLLEFCLFPRLSVCVCVCVFPDCKPTTSPEQRPLPAALQAFCHPPLPRQKMWLSSGMQIRSRSFIPRSCWPFSYLCPLSPSPSRRWRPWLRDDSRLPHWSSAKHSPDHGAHPGRKEHIFIVLQLQNLQRRARVWPLVLVCGTSHAGFVHGGFCSMGWNMLSSKI